MRSTACLLVLFFSSCPVSASVVVSYWEVGGVALAQSGAYIDMAGGVHEGYTVFDFHAVGQQIGPQSVPIYQTLHSAVDLGDEQREGEVVHYAAKSKSDTTYWLDLSQGISWGGTMDFAEYHTPDTVIGDNFYNGTASGSINLYIRFDVFNADALLNYAEDHYTNTYEPGLANDLSGLTLTNLTTNEVLWNTTTDGYLPTNLTLPPGEYLLTGAVGQLYATIPGTTTETYSRAVSLSVVPEVSPVGLVGLALAGLGFVRLRQSKA